VSSRHGEPAGTEPEPNGSIPAECPSCGVKNRPGARFCGECASPLARAQCAACGESFPQGQKFCDACGQPVGLTPVPSAPREPPAPPPHLAARILAEKAALPARGGERKLITSLFADIQGSVELMQDLDPEAAAEIVDPLLDIMIETIHQFEGYVDKCTGDGILALFGAPIAQEDHAQRAALAAVRIQQRIAEYAADLERRGGPAVRARIGLNSGQAVLRAIRKDDLRVEYTPIGHATNLAARLQTLAPPGGVLASEATYRLADGFVEFREAGAVPVKGVREPVPTYEVVGAGQLNTRLERSARRGLSPFTGRDAELRQLRRALDLTLAGTGQVVALLGEPGIGKSRLFHEFAALSRANCVVLEGHALPHAGSAPYLPLIVLLRGLFGITTDDGPELRQQKVAAHVTELDPSLDDATPYLLHLLGVSDPSSPIRQMDGALRRHRTFDAVKRLLLQESIRQPLVLMFEDLQWIDGETQAILDLLVESIASASCLLLVNYRPEYEHRWGRKTYYTQLSVEALDELHGSQILSRLLGDDPELDDVKRLILDKSEGNPFFIEEIIQTLIDRGAVRRGDEGITLVASPLNIEIPETVQGVLMARIDRLPDGDRRLLQTLSVIGRAFSANLARQVVDVPEEELVRTLAALQDAEFINERTTATGTRYTFKHALTQLVSYESMLGANRRALHERVAEAIEEQAVRLEDYYGELAHHYRLGSNLPKAIGFLQLAAAQAIQRSAHNEAVEHLQTALELLERLPEGPERLQRELAIQVSLGLPLALTRGYADPEAGRVLLRAQELCEQVQSSPQLFPVLFGLWAFYLVRGEHALSRQMAVQLLEMAHAADNTELLLEAHRALGATLFFAHELEAAREHLEAGLALYDQTLHAHHAFVFGQDPGVSCFAYLGNVLWHLGYPDAAETTAERGVELAQRIAHPFSIAFAHDMAAAVHQFRRNADRALEHAERAIAVSTEHGFQLWANYGKMLRSWALVYRGKHETQPADLRDALAGWRATGAGVCGPYMLGMIAESYAEFDEPRAGLELIEEALQAVERSDERFWEPELMRLRGKLMAEVGGVADTQIEAALREAVSIAEHRQARGLELRSARTLCWWLGERAAAAEARKSLQSLLDSFTEGLDTADAQDAERLLAALTN
jgi:predicted ATPase/class 3 adenylate cyclase